MTVSLSLSGTYQVHWKIFTTAFREVAQGSSASLSGGRLVWDPRGMANGIYYWRVEAKDAQGSQTQIAKVLILR